MGPIEYGIRHPDVTRPFDYCKPLFKCNKWLSVQGIVHVQCRGSSRAGEARRASENVVFIPGMTVASDGIESCGVGWWWLSCVSIEDRTSSVNRSVDDDWVISDVDLKCL